MSGVELRACEGSYDILLDGECIGFIEGNGCYLLQIDVYPEYRGCGYGKQAVKRYIEQCRLRGAEVVETGTVVSGALESILVDLGFERVDEMENRWRLPLNDA